MSATRSAVLKKAASQIGYAESPAGSNRTKYGAWYGLNGHPWCAMFVSWVAAQCHALDIIPKHAYTPAGADWFKRHNRWHTHPKAGDIAYFDFPGDGVKRISHVGFVERVRADGMVVTIEGNTSAGDNRNGGMVMRRVRSPKNIVGYGRPAYLVPVKPKMPVLRKGSAGGAVITLKKALKKAGYKGFDVTSHTFGDGTLAAVNSFKKKHGLKPNGIVGAGTWKALGY